MRGSAELGVQCFAGRGFGRAPQDGNASGSDPDPPIRFPYTLTRVEAIGDQSLLLAPQASFHISRARITSEIALGNQYIGPLTESLQVSEERRPIVLAHFLP